MTSKVITFIALLIGLECVFSNEIAKPTRAKALISNKKYVGSASGEITEIDGYKILHDFNFPDVTYPTSLLDSNQPFYFNINSVDIVGPFPGDIDKDYKTLVSRKEYSTKKLPKNFPFEKKNDTKVKTPEKVNENKNNETNVIQESELIENLIASIKSKMNDTLCDVSIEVIPEIIIETNEDSSTEVKEILIETLIEQEVLPENSTEPEKNNILSTTVILSSHDFNVTEVDDDHLHISAENNTDGMEPELVNIEILSAEILLEAEPDVTLPIIVSETIIENFSEPEIDNTTSTMSETFNIDNSSNDTNTDINVNKSEHSDIDTSNKVPLKESVVFDVIYKDGYNLDNPILDIVPTNIPVRLKINIEICKDHLSMQNDTELFDVTDSSQNIVENEINFVGDNNISEELELTQEEQIIVLDEINDSDFISALSILLLDSLNNKQMELVTPEIIDMETNLNSTETTDLLTEETINVQINSNLNETAAPTTLNVNVSNIDIEDNIDAQELDVIETGTDSNLSPDCNEYDSRNNDTSGESCATIKVEPTYSTEKSIEDLDVFEIWTNSDELELIYACPLIDMFKYNIINPPESSEEYSEEESVEFENEDSEEIQFSCPLIIIKSNNDSSTKSSEEVIEEENKDSISKNSEEIEQNCSSNEQSDNANNSTSSREVSKEVSDECLEKESGELKHSADSIGSSQNGSEEESKEVEKADINNSSEEIEHSCPLHIFKSDKVNEHKASEEHCEEKSEEYKQEGSKEITLSCPLIDVFKLKILDHSEDKQESEEHSTR